MPILTRDRPSSERADRTGRWLGTDAVAIALGSVLALLLAATISRPPDTVDELTIDNPHEYDLNVSIRAVDEAAWLPLPVAAADAETRLVDVIDQGDRWEVSVRAQGLDGGRFTVERPSLEGDEWRLVIPDEVAERLRSKGAAPSPG